MDIIKKNCCSNNNCESPEIKRYLPNDILNYIKCCLLEEHYESKLINILHMIQNHFGYISDQSMNEVAELMHLPISKIFGVASFYHYFRLKPCGKYIISICLGTACYVKGAESIMNKFSEELGIKVGEVTHDGMFSLEISRCLGACALAPVVKIGNKVYSQMTPEKVSLIIKKLIESSNVV